MKYISFYSDDNFYYCCSDDGKIFRGKNTEKFVPNTGYFISITLTLFLGDVLNRFLVEKIRTAAAIIMIAVGIIISFVIGYIAYNQIENKAKRNYKEIYLTDAQMKDYIEKGKRQFKIQKLILFFMIIFAIIFYSVFYLLHNLIVFFLANAMCFLLALIIRWIKLLQKEKFFKTQA